MTNEFLARMTNKEYPDRYIYQLFNSETTLIEVQGWVDSQLSIYENLEIMRERRDG